MPTRQSLNGRNSFGSSEGEKKGGGHEGDEYSPDSYNTRSNKVRVIKTPGGELRYLHIKKKGTAPKCGDCGIKLPGVCYPNVPILAAPLILTDWCRITFLMVVMIQ